MYLLEFYLRKVIHCQQSEVPAAPEFWRQDRANANNHNDTKAHTKSRSPQIWPHKEALFSNSQLTFQLKEMLN